MPREKSGDVAHEQVTDHRIQRRPAPSSTQMQARTGDLTLVGGGPVSDRDLGLAYFQMANLGDQQAGHRAMELLQRAERHEDQPDPDLHRALGFLAHLAGDRAMAMHEYEATLRTNPADSMAAGDLAILEARAGNPKAAITLLEGISQHDPGETTAGIDLAMIDCAIGHPKAATQALHQVLEFSPDDAKAQSALSAIETKPETCKGSK